jgi:hypothetical protein
MIGGIVPGTPLSHTQEALSRAAAGPPDSPLASILNPPRSSSVVSSELARTRAASSSGEGAKIAVGLTGIGLIVLGATALVITLLTGNNMTDHVLLGSIAFGGASVGIGMVCLAIARGMRGGVKKPEELELQEMGLPRSPGQSSVESQKSLTPEQIHQQELRQVRLRSLR